MVIETSDQKSLAKAIGGAASLGRHSLFYRDSQAQAKSSNGGNSRKSNRIICESLATRGYVNRDIREKYWKQLAGRHKPGTWEVLDAGYSESHRAYHTWPHVSSLLEKLSAFSGLCTREDLIATTVFWHDAVYRTQCPDGSPRTDYENVHESGQLFREYTLLNKADTGAVYDMIMASANHLQPELQKQYYAGFAGDVDLFLDLDLSSLASPWNEFVENLVKIRSEFSWLPEADFYASQIDFLERFARDDVLLYRCKETSDKWRDAAKANLRRCVKCLEKRASELKAG
jgi:predicted metal-dependent HD superfamily phosphohydrolase